jgi:hypothetical protein
MLIQLRFNIIGFMIGMNTLGLLDPPPTAPFHGYSFLALGEAVKNITEPSYAASHGTSRTRKNSENEHRSCSLKVKIDLIIDEQLQKTNGLDLNSFVNKS